MSKTSKIQSVLEEIESLLYNHEKKINTNLVLGKIFYVLTLMTDLDD